MQVVLIVFMAVVMCVTIVTLAMMVSDMVRDRRDRKAVPAAPAPVTVYSVRSSAVIAFICSAPPVTRSMFVPLRIPYRFHAAALPPCTALLETDGVCFSAP